MLELVFPKRFLSCSEKGFWNFQNTWRRKKGAYKLRWRKYKQQKCQEVNLVSILMYIVVKMQWSFYLPSFDISKDDSQKYKYIMWMTTWAATYNYMLLNSNELSFYRS